METNQHRNEIIRLINNAENEIQIAVSWLTDELIIDELTKVARRGIEVELLLSRDPLNAAFRYSNLIRLQQVGAKVLKIGASFPGEKGFMHAKFLIIDKNELIGGSYNYTRNASYNYEVMGKYDSQTLNQYINDFQSWKKEAVGYEEGFENPQAIKELVLKQFQENNKFKELMLKNYNGEFKKSQKDSNSERDILIAEELKKEKLKDQAESLVNGKNGVSSSGMISSSENTAQSKPHRFYGGEFRTNFKDKQKGGNYAVVYFQKQLLNKKFPFLKSYINNNTLVCTGTVEIPNCRSYDIRIEFKGGHIPQVYITNHKIVPDSDNHVYSNKSLCLFYPPDQNWSDYTSIADHTIPWIFEWVINYELYLLSGKWHGDFVPHEQIKNF